jgi:uncharacterized membrane protein YccF (DUF307 family)
MPATLTLLLNVLWLIFGGFISALAWLLAALIMAITIIGLPWVPAAIRIAGFTAWPFGRHIVPREMASGRDDLGTGPTGCLLNGLWIVFAGWWLALHHLAIGLAQCLTIIGIPFGWQHFKLALLAIAPVGKEIVDA